MAFQHGIAATLSIGGTAFAGYLTSATMNLTRAMGEIRLLGQADDAVVRVPGLRDVNFTCNGAWDATADAALFALYDGSAAGAIIFSPDEGVTTYTVNCWIPEYTINTPSDGAATWTIRLASDGDVTRA